MLYVTIIVVSILIIGCIIACNYLNKVYNPSLYNSEDDLNAINIITKQLLDRYEEYENADEKDKYLFRISDKEFIDNIQNINEISRL
jgi:hypothetical protein